LAVQAKKEGCRGGMVTAGFVLSIIGTTFAAFYTLSVTFAFLTCAFMAPWTWSPWIWW